MEISLLQALRDGWQTFKTRPLLFIAVTLATELVPFLLIPFDSLPACFIGLLLSIELTSFLWLKAAAREQVKGADLLHSLRLLPSYIGCALLTYLLIILLRSIAYFPFFDLLCLLLPNQRSYLSFLSSVISELSIFVWTLWPYILPPFLYLRLAFAHYRIFEGSDPTRAIAQSWQISRGASTQMLLVVVQSYLILFLLLLLMEMFTNLSLKTVILILYSVPLMGLLIWPIANLALASLYHQLTGQPTSSILPAPACERHLDPV